MQIKALLFAPLVASGLVSAAPAASTKSAPFEILTLRSASPIHFNEVQAARNSIFLQLPNQKAVCDKKSDNAATFQIVDGVLHLYRSSGTQQTLFTDRSGMGQGVLQYATGDAPLPRNGERKGWKIDKNGDLTFNGSGFIACPGSISNSWSVWLDAGVSNPGGNKNCLGFTARTVKVSKPNSCKYTERK
ncbi:hypothetical protein AK830_g10751 [Neonectria ditissima]|uniref:Cell wall protein PhiA n=1 Tax=Neonectria ditissima TaxID=78410 RepID=A0A0P7ASQ7_9HYPO|nr:hypothetical protein AK830_g10751 [Neonectria ditissima]